MLLENYVKFVPFNIQNVVVIEALTLNYWWMRISLKGEWFFPSFNSNNFILGLEHGQNLSCGERTENVFAVFFSSYSELNPSSPRDLTLKYQ